MHTVPLRTCIYMRDAVVLLPTWSGNVCVVQVSQCTELSGAAMKSQLEVRNEQLPLRAYKGRRTGESCWGVVQVRRRTSIVRMERRLGPAHSIPHVGLEEASNCAQSPRSRVREAARVKEAKGSQVRSMRSICGRRRPIPRYMARLSDHGKHLGP